MTASIMQIVGLITISIGLGMLYTPLGIISAGAAMLIVGLALEKDR